MIGAPPSSPRPLADWERITRDLLEEGQTFLAHDAAREGLADHPDAAILTILGAVALSRSGAPDEARRLLRPVLDDILIDETPFLRLRECLRRAIDGLRDPGDGAIDKDSLARMADLAEALELVRGKKLDATADAETYTALAGVLREAWLASGSREDLRHARELYLRAYHAGQTPRDGVDAALAAWMSGDHAAARELARQVRDLIRGNRTAGHALTPEQRFQRLTTLGEAHLLLGEEDEATAAFEQASALDGVHYGSVVAALRQLALLRDGGIAVPDAVNERIRPPTVVVFTGHPLDRPGEGVRFPPELEAAVRGEIARSLDDLGAQVGYSMAACGADLLFIEAMLERGGEVNVVMPYALDDFLAENVRYGGTRWEMRFRNALKLANTVTYATEERFLGHDMLYRFANQCLHGLATLRAGVLRTAPYLLAVWDMMPGSLVGGAADFIDQWEDISHLRIIDLDDLLRRLPDFGDSAAAPVEDTAATAADAEAGEGRVIRSMMFCDIAGYSRLKEEHTPVFLDFMRIISRGMAELAPQPIAVNTWGDAIFAVMAKASPMAEYALHLQEMVRRADEDLRDRLPHPLNLRVSLHAGPVFQAEDPIRGHLNFYGSHINRAARLEPVTVIGHVYATQQFVAVLTAEQSAARSEAMTRDEPFTDRYACDYVGVLSLAKDFGRQAVYHLRRRPVALRPSPAVDDVFSAPGFSEDDLAAILAETMAADAMQPPPVSPPPLVFGTVMSDDDIAALLAETAPDPDPAPPPYRPSPMSDDDIAALLAETIPEPDPAPPPHRPAPMSDDDIATLLAEIDGDDDQTESRR